MHNFLVFRAHFDENKPCIKKNIYVLYFRNEISEEDLQHLAGVFSVNGVTIGNLKGSCYGKGLYSTFSILNHHCIGNAKYKIDPRSWMITVKAHQPIMKGEEIMVQYLSTILGTHKRRKRIKGNEPNSRYYTRYLDIYSTICSVFPGLDN